MFDIINVTDLKPTDTSWWFSQIPRIEKQYNVKFIELSRIDSLITETKNLLKNKTIPKYLFKCDNKITESNSTYFDMNLEYSKLKPNETMSYNDSAMIIMDGELLKDSTILYFLPRLIIAVFKEEGNEDLLLWRLESIDSSVLNPKKKSLLTKIIKALKEWESLIEIIDKEENDF
jgi:hypothetical protein